MSPERIAPEWFGFENGRPTIPSDCYALGMVIYETISGNIPFHKDTDLTVSMKVVKGKRPPQGANFTEDLWGMLGRCWASRPNNRPRIEDVLRYLEMAPNLSDPPSPGVEDGMNEDSDDWDSLANSDEPVDFPATDDRVQLSPVDSLQGRRLTDSRHASPEAPPLLSYPRQVWRTLRRQPHYKANESPDPGPQPPVSNVGSWAGPPFVASVEREDHGRGEGGKNDPRMEYLQTAGDTTTTATTDFVMP